MAFDGLLNHSLLDALLRTRDDSALYGLDEAWILGSCLATLSRTWCDEIQRPTTALGV